MTRRNILISLAALFAGVLIGLLVLREPTEPLTAEALRRARQCWQDSGIAAYTIQYEMNTDLYEVTVENRIVAAATVNGRPPQTGSLRSYSVEGLFDLLALELENLSDPQGPFAGRIGAIPARVRFHHRYGYPERYIRGAAPAGRGARIEVLRFNTAGPPPERSPGAPESARTLPIDEGGVAGADRLGHHEGHEDSRRDSGRGSRVSKGSREPFTLLLPCSVPSFPSCFVILRSFDPLCARSFLLSPWASCPSWSKTQRDGRLGRYCVHAALRAENSRFLEKSRAICYHSHIMGLALPLPGSWHAPRVKQAEAGSPGNERA